MKNRLTALTVLLALLGVPLFLAAQSPAATQSKVGVINIQEAIGASAEGKKAFADLSKKYQPRQQELQRLQQEIQALQDQLTKGANTLSDEEQRRLGRDIEDKQKLLKRSSEDAQADFGADRDEAIRRIGQKMVHIISEYAQQNGYSLIVDDAQIPVYYASKDIDITEEVVKRFDAANPAPEAAAPAAPAARPTSPAKPAATTPKPAGKPK
jgi:Skp family chaperone for outer membrane proteins